MHRATNQFPGSFWDTRQLRCFASARQTQAAIHPHKEALIYEHFIERKLKRGGGIGQRLPRNSFSSGM